MLQILFLLNLKTKCKVITAASREFKKGQTISPASGHTTGTKGKKQKKPSRDLFEFEVQIAEVTRKLYLCRENFQTTQNHPGKPSHLSNKENEHCRSQQVSHEGFRNEFLC